MHKFGWRPVKQLIETWKWGCRGNPSRVLGQRHGDKQNLSALSHPDLPCVLRQPIKFCTTSKLSDYYQSNDTPNHKKNGNPFKYQLWIKKYKASHGSATGTYQDIRWTRSKYCTYVSWKKTGRLLSTIRLTNLSKERPRLIKNRRYL